MKPDVAALLAILNEVSVLLASVDNDYTWSSFVDADAAVHEIGELAAVVRGGGIPIGLGILFAPTGPIQEVAISSGWGDRFLVLADRLDAALEVGSTH